jgi:hypothetical protein
MDQRSEAKLRIARFMIQERESNHPLQALYSPSLNANREDRTGSFVPFTSIRESCTTYDPKGRFPFVPEGHAIVAWRFIAGLAIDRICVPEGRLKLDLGCYQSSVADRFEVKNSTHPRSEFRRPSGTQAMGSRTPAINRRATVICPSGTARRAMVT